MRSRLLKIAAEKYKTYIATSFSSQGRFLAMVVALHFTLHVSQSVSPSQFRTGVASRLASLFLSGSHGGSLMDGSLVFRRASISQTHIREYVSVFFFRLLQLRAEIFSDCLKDIKNVNCVNNTNNVNNFNNVNHKRVNVAPLAHHLRPIFGLVFWGLR